MSRKYSDSKDIPSEVLANRLEQLSEAVVARMRNDTLVFESEFTCRIPAELDRDADLVISEAGDRLKRLEQECDELKDEVAKLTRRNDLIIEEAERESRDNRRLRIDRFKRFNEEDCWIYGGDGHDNLETLICPVVLQPQQLLEILQERDELKECLNDVRRLTKELDVALNGDNAASQPSLCDLVGQVKMIGSISEIKAQAAMTAIKIAAREFARHGITEEAIDRFATRYAERLHNQKEGDDE